MPAASFVTHEVLNVRIETRRFKLRILNVKQGHSWQYRILCSKVHSQEPCNYDYYDHDADDVKNVHCALLRMHARLQREVATLQFGGYAC